MLKLMIHINVPIKFKPTITMTKRYFKYRTLIIIDDAITTKTIF